MFSLLMLLTIIRAVTAITDSKPTAETTVNMMCNENIIFNLLWYLTMMT